MCGSYSLKRVHRVIATGDGGIPSQAGDRHRRGGVGGWCRCELAGGVVAPGLDGAVPPRERQMNEHKLRMSF